MENKWLMRVIAVCAVIATGSILSYTNVITIDPQRYVLSHKKSSCIGALKAALKSPRSLNVLEVSQYEWQPDDSTYQSSIESSHQSVYDVSVKYRAENGIGATNEGYWACYFDAESEGFIKFGSRGEDSMDAAIYMIENY